MQKEMVQLGNCKIEVLTEGDRFLGLGTAFIGDTRVRSGRLPLRPYTQSFQGYELTDLKYLGTETASDQIRIKVEAEFKPLEVKLMRDHSFDPIHETGDWNISETQKGRLDIVLKPATDSFEGWDFDGFSYHYEYISESVPLFYILDKATWELDGDITGATAISQSSCSAPIAVFDDDTEWTTEGVLHFADGASIANTTMTHNLPRWASHGSFDFQYKGDKTLIGVFEKVDLIRSIIERNAGKAELKTFDKYIFDEALEHSTTPKKILLNTQKKSDVTQKNLWTWIFDAVADRARAEFGLKEEPLRPRLGQNHWDDFIIDDYRKNLLPAAQNMGIKSLFIDNMNKSAATERCPHPEFHWNMCCGHEYEIAPSLGGKEMLSKFMKDCDADDIKVFSWTNNDQALSSPVNKTERDERKWFVKMEDTRLKYGGAYGNVFSILNFEKEAPRRYWIDCLKKNKEETGLRGYLFDSFYNLGFMPVDYTDGKPTTQWRGLLSGFKELQDAGIHFMIESFGPFGEVQHGCPSSYNFDNLFACYKVGMGTGYTTIPTGQEKPRADLWPLHQYYKILAYMTKPGHPLFLNGTRIDKLFTPEHKQALADYNNNHVFMKKRIMQEDDKAVIWHDAEGSRATIWNFETRDAKLPGKVRDLTTGQDLPQADTCRLEACHTYAVTDCELPAAI